MSATTGARSDADIPPELDVYEHEARWQADCPGCGMAGRVTPKLDGLVLFDCDAHCGAGSGVYRSLSYVPFPIGRGTRDTRFGTRGVDLSLIRPVRFSYRPFVVRGRLNLMVGEEDAGKSTLQAWIAARLTNGELPGEFKGKPGDVLFVGADEDDWNEIVVPRLHAAGADLERVFEFYGKSDTAVFNVVDHIGQLNRELQERAYALVVFEQIMDVLPPMKNAADPVALRSALRPLRQVLRVREVGGQGTLHVNKNEAATLRQRMQGSMQFGALSRSTALVDRHPEDEDRRVLVLGKANYVKASEPRALSFAIESSAFTVNDQAFDVGVVADVRAESELRIQEVLKPATERDREREERAERLAEALTEEPQSLRELAVATGIPKSTVARLLDDVLAPAGRAGKVDDGWVSRVPRRKDWDMGQDDEADNDE